MAWLLPFSTCGVDNDMKLSDCGIPLCASLPEAFEPGG